MAPPSCRVSRWSEQAKRIEVNVPPGLSASMKIVISLPLFFFNWRWALVLFIVGWILQFVGHAIEGNQPAFFRNPVYLLIGPLWLLRRAASLVGLSRPKELK